MDAFGAGRYRVIAPLGAGAFAEVFEVEDTRLGVRRALKLLRPEAAADPTARARFAAEARTMASLSHPHLVGVTDVGEDVGLDGITRAWLVMELLPGGTLAEAIARTGAGDPVEACRAMLGVIEGVALAHARGVIHRDIKPANLLLDGDGRLKLGDFGIAQLRSLDDLTRTGVALGSWAFMAPEQRLDPRRVGPASDVYGLAATLTWWIHGGPVSDLHVAEHRARLLARAPEAIAGVLARALAFRADERFRSAEAFGGALGEALGEGEGAPPEVAGAVDRPPAFVQRDPSAVGSTSPQRPPGVGAAGWAVATGVVALLAGVAAGVWVALRDDMRGVLVEEPEEVRRARLLASIRVCEDAPQRWDMSSAPRDSASPPGKREAGGGRIADVDRDGHPDIVYAHQLDEGFRIFWGDASGRMPRAGQDIDAPRMNMGTIDGVDVADVDGDGWLDLLGTATESRGVVLVRGTGHRAFGPPQLIESGGVPYGVRAVDWDADGTLDLVMRTQASSAPMLYWRRGLGGLTFDSTERLYVGGQAFEIADVLPDDGPELLVADSSNLHVYARTKDARVGVEHVQLPLPDPDIKVLRWVTNGARSALIAASGTPGHTATLLRIHLQPTLDVCAMRIPAAFVLDAGHVNDDDLVDLSAVVTCSYCTTSYQVFSAIR